MPKPLGCSPGHCLAASTGAMLSASYCLVLSTSVPSCLLLPEVQFEVAISSLGITLQKLLPCPSFPISITLNLERPRRRMGKDCFRAVQVTHRTQGCRVCLAILDGLNGATCECPVLSDACGPRNSCSCCCPGQLRSRHWNEVSSVHQN